MVLDPSPPPLVKRNVYTIFWCTHLHRQVHYALLSTEALQCITVLMHIPAVVDQARALVALGALRVSGHHLSRTHLHKE